MKKITLFVLIAFGLCTIAEAKKVKFSVNMTGQVINPNGIHVTGDFQVAAGFGGNNWDCGVMQLTKETTDTNIYSLVVDIPAFQKYEYKFVNGEFCYEVEVIPESAAANYNFSDNRWIYVDSLSNDTTNIGAVLFNNSAPANYILVRYRINMMQEATISPNGVHVAGTFQGWDPAKNRLYSFSNSVYEWISYVTPGNYEFKYYNGNTTGDTETVPSTCATNGNRTINVTQDTVVSLLCYSSCNLCFPASVNNYSLASQLNIAPNPMNSFTTIQFKDLSTDYMVQLFDMTGKIIYKQLVSGKESLRLENANYQPGIYLLKIRNKLGNQTSVKLVIE